MEILAEKIGGKRVISEGLMGGSGAITDEELLNLCVKFGARALKWRRRFMGLLPEVQKRWLFEKKGFNSIFEFAFKLAGLSEKQVRMVLSLGSRFEDKPVLKSLLESGEVSVNKLARVASIATLENEEELAEKVRILPKGALETLVRDHKMFENGDGSGADWQSVSDEKVRNSEGQNGLNETLFGHKSLPGQTLNFEISEEVARELNHLNSQGQNVNKIILELLKKRKEEIVQKKEQLGQAAIERLEDKKAALKPGQKLKTSSYVSVKVKAVLKEEYGDKCSIPGCCKLAEGNHHAQRRALVGIDDPRYMAPMCKEHHQIAHTIDQKYVSTLLRHSRG